jgi:hypothetical protein
MTHRVFIVRFIRDVHFGAPRAARARAGGAEDREKRRARNCDAFSRVLFCLYQPFDVCMCI